MAGVPPPWDVLPGLEESNRCVSEALAGPHVSCVRRGEGRGSCCTCWHQPGGLVRAGLALERCGCPWAAGRWLAVARSYFGECLRTPYSCVTLWDRVVLSGPEPSFLLPSA